jgi:hypothetical protein
MHHTTKLALHVLEIEDWTTHFYGVIIIKFKSVF